MTELENLERQVTQNRKLLVALAEVVMAQLYLAAPGTPLGRALRELDKALVETKPE